LGGREGSSRVGQESTPEPRRGRGKEKPVPSLSLTRRKKTLFPSRKEIFFLPEKERGKRNLPSLLSERGEKMPFRG